jgi:hypothetical protein
VLTKEDWLAACIALRAVGDMPIGCFPLALFEQLKN